MLVKGETIAQWYSFEAGTRWRLMWEGDLMSALEDAQYNSLKQCTNLQEHRVNQASMRELFRAPLKLNKSCRVIVAWCKLSTVDQESKKSLHPEGRLRAWERQDAAPQPYRERKSRA
jgi:hypothetical protein